MELGPALIDLVPSFDMIGTLEKDEGEISVVQSLFGSFFISASNDPRNATLKLWDLSHNPALVQTFTGHKARQKHNYSTSKSNPLLARHHYDGISSLLQCYRFGR